MRVRLLNNDGYSGMSDVQFPVVVDCTRFEPGILDIYYVKGSSLIAAGADVGAFDPEFEYNLKSKGDACASCEVITDV